MNKADTVYLCGGPVYQKNIYPNIFSLKLEKIMTPIIPFGVGWKGMLSESSHAFNFSEDSNFFLKEIHKNIKFSSCRDLYTQDVLAKIGIKNSVMTGCPAWYDLSKIGTKFKYNEVKKIVFSDPAKVTAQSFETIRVLDELYPNTEKTLALHHGLYPRLDRRGIKFAMEHLALIAYAKTRGFKVESLAGNLNKMKNIYDECDLHIGFRVHAHIYCISQRSPSLLISEDSRGVGQSEALGMTVLKANSSNYCEKLKTEINRLSDQKSKYFDPTFDKLEHYFAVMKEFLNP